MLAVLLFFSTSNLQNNVYLETRTCQLKRDIVPKTFQVLGGSAICFPRETTLTQYQI